MMPQSAYESAHTYVGLPCADTSLAPPTVLASLAAHARARGEAPYLTLVAEHEERTLSYLELDVLSRRLASELRRNWGARSGDVLALLPTNDVDSIVAVYAVLRLGSSLLFLNPSDPAVRLRAQLDALGAGTILRSRLVSEDLLAEAIAIPDASKLDDDESPVERPPPPNSAALFFGTSGSTAASKVVAQSHHNAVINAYAVGQHLRLRRLDRLLGCLPLHHVNGVHFTLFATLVAGAHAVVVNKFEPHSYLDALERSRPRIASVVPSVLEVLLDAGGDRSLPREFDYFVSAAAPLTARTARAVRARFGARVVQGYGLTETTNFSTMIPGDLSDDAFRRLVLDADLPSVGTALYGNEVAVLNPDGTRAAVGETGELCMRGHNVMIGYAGNAAATAEAFRHGWFHSGDLGREVIDAVSGGRYVSIVGRIKNIAKVAGEAVSLEEMERTLRLLPAVQDSACVSRPHRLLGDEIIAAVVLSEDLRVEELRKHLSRKFAPVAQPRHIVKLTSIPRTPTGKIRRQELVQQLAALVSGHAD